MKIRTQLALAAVLVTATVGLHTSTASAMSGIKLDTALATASDHVSVENVALVCGPFACVRTHGYRYGYGYANPYRAYGYGYGYGYRPSFYRPAVRFGFS